VLTNDNDLALAVLIVLPADGRGDTLSDRLASHHIAAVDFSRFVFTPTTRPFLSSAIASQLVQQKTNADLQDRPRSRKTAKALLPFTSLQNTAIAVR
jgi:hypothetical protein